MTTHNDNGSLELWLKVVREIIGGPTNELVLLDLCCNECTGTKQLGFNRHVGVDVENWSTRPANVEFHEMDVLEAIRGQVASRGCDVCICSDGIEHLPKKEGAKLLKQMARVAPIAIIFTPLGDYMVNPDATSPHDHRSGWKPEEFTAIGWEVSVYPNWHPTLNCGAFFAWKKSK
jgi:hypothetical protein